jgi:hypothetical protein
MDLAPAVILFNLKLSRLNMKVDLNPTIAALLEARVAAGHYASIEEAVTAAVLGIGEDESGAFGDLSWAKPYLAEAKASLTQGEGIDDEAVWAKIEQRFGSVR